MSLPVTKKSKNDANKEESGIDISKEAKGLIDKILGDVSKTSATKQIIIGTASGWLALYTCIMEFSIFINTLSQSLRQKC